MENMYRQKVLDRYHQPQFRGVVNQPDIEVSQTNPLCGDKVALQFKLNQDSITQVAWQGEGCAISQVASDLLAEHAIGLSLDQLFNITPDQLVAWLNIEIKPARLKCATLPLLAIHQLKPPQ
jgi:nitrogen fixation NifU-like protein